MWQSPTTATSGRRSTKKLEKHPDLREQLEMWGVKTSVIPMVIGAPKLGERF